ncbi:MAG TPA: hypothetical protein VHZ51_02625 [Ktedonobacteraceae bacterium]|nr:hypothetical protein [Ktedonobacteraceae bacterium]
MLWTEDQESSVQLGNLVRLRRKLEESPIIETLPGFGYRIVDQPAEECERLSWMKRSIFSSWPVASR